MTYWLIREGHVRGKGRYWCGRHWGQWHERVMFKNRTAAWQDCGVMNRVVRVTR